MEEQQRAFRGVWIPAEIWLDDKLTVMEKVLYAEIDSFCSKGRECFANNAHFAKMLQVSERQIQRLLVSLEEKGVIQGYQTIINSSKTAEGVSFVIDIEATTESFQEVLDVLCHDKYIRQVYGITGNCRVHCRGFAPNNHTLETHVRYLYNHNNWNID